MAADGKSTVVQVPIQSSQIGYVPYIEGNLPPPRDLERTLAAAEGYRASPLPDDPTFSPIRIEVHPRSDVRGEIAQRVCLLGRDRMTWKVFVLEDGIRNGADTAIGGNEDHGRSGRDGEVT